MQKRSASTSACCAIVLQSIRDTTAGNIDFGSGKNRPSRIAALVRWIAGASVCPGQTGWICRFSLLGRRLVSTLQRNKGPSF